VHAGFRCLQHLPVAAVDRHVRDVCGRCGVGVVEEQITWLQVTHRYLRSGQCLVGRDSRHDDASLREGPLHQAGAVERLGLAAPQTYGIPIRLSAAVRNRAISASLSPPPALLTPRAPAASEPAALATPVPAPPVVTGVPADDC